MGEKVLMRSSSRLGSVSRQRERADQLNKSSRWTVQMVVQIVAPMTRRSVQCLPLRGDCSGGGRGGVRLLFGMRRLEGRGAGRQCC